jgi:uncharacterized protein YbbC (DUF1343 family)
MKKTTIIIFLLSIFISCKSSDHSNTESGTKSVSPISEDTSKLSNSGNIVLGAEQMASYLPLLQGKRVGLVVNQTSTIGTTHLVDSLKKLGVSIQKVFAPEHGFRGDHSAGAVIKNGFDLQSGLPVVSLYGSNKKPTAAMLADIDVVLFDIQDVGVRFYTYISTMHYVMEACAELNKKVIILDRPNPNGFYIDGPILEPEYASFIGMHPIPIVHGLTVGELAQMINGKKWLKGEVICDITVIPCLNYSHKTRYELPIKPSPNLPNMTSVYLYPYLGLFEGTNVSLGRGTELPFQVVGRPGFSGNYTFTPRSIPGVADDPKYEGKLCSGEIVKDVADGSLFANPRLNLSWLILFYQTNKASDGEYFQSFFYKLAGTKSLKTQIEQGVSEESIRATWQSDLVKYKEMRKKYLLYP